MQHAARNQVGILESPITPENAYVSKRERLALADTIRKLLNLVFEISQAKDLSEEANFGRQNRIIKLKNEISELKKVLDDFGVNDIDFAQIGL